MKILKLKKGYVFFSAIIAFMLHLPFAFSGTKSFSYKTNIPTSDSSVAASPTTILTSSKIYDSLKLNICGLSEQAFGYAFKGYEYLKLKGKLGNENILSIVDFSRPSSQKRLFVIDIKNFKILFNTYVAHGQGSGAAMATSFSNIPESYQSSLGFYTTSGTYIGKNGFSMHLEGMERGINDKANERAIVMHGAPYVSENFIHNQGFLGRSWGCPAVPEKLNKPIIEKIKNGTCLFIFSKNEKYLHNSIVLNS
ncbi:MAG: murein L,D-transpeptidase catalytic domain family protein [Ferruginibacter sp.]|nr:murein L,D-transpeptidase catalytic domain family protein [Ferruginibacter sp.]